MKGLFSFISLTFTYRGSSTIFVTLDSRKEQWQIYWLLMISLASVPMASQDSQEVAVRNLFSLSKLRIESRVDLRGRPVWSSHLPLQAMSITLFLLLGSSICTEALTKALEEG